MRYHAKKVEIDGFVFDSGHEGDVYLDLKLQQRAGLISKLQIHPKFHFFVQGILVGTMKPDFTYLDEKDMVRVVDAKGFKKSPRTGKLLPRVDREFGIKRKLMKALFGLEIEIR